MTLQSQNQKSIAEVFYKEGNEWKLFVDVATFGQDITVAHDTTHVAAVAATANKAGNIEYWHDQYCGKYFKDAELTEEISYEDTIVPATGETTNPDNPGDKPDKEPVTPSEKPSG